MRLEKDSECLYMGGRPQIRQGGNQENYNQFVNSNNKKNMEIFRLKFKTKNRKCYGCGKVGHFIKDCYKKKNEHRDKNLD